MWINTMKKIHSIEDENWIIYNMGGSCNVEQNKLWKTIYYMNPLYMVKKTRWNYGTTSQNNNCPWG